MTRLRAVVDTNVLISALMNERSLSAKALIHVIENFVLLASVETWDEIEAKLHNPKFNKYWDEEARATFLTNIAMQTKFVDTTSIISDCRDKDDNKFLALAIDGGADLIVSGDNDLRVLSPYRNIQILSPAEFLNKIS